MTAETEPNEHRSDLDPTPATALARLSRCCPFAGTRGRRHKKPAPEIPSMPEVSGPEKAVASNAVPALAPTVAVPVSPSRREAFLEPLEPAAPTARELGTLDVNSCPLPSPISSGAATSREADNTLRKTAHVTVPLIEQFEARLDLGENVGAKSGLREKNTMAPATEIPSWWVGKDPVPIELLDDSGDVSLPPINSDIENLLPPLPSLRPQWISAPSKESPPRKTQGTETVGDVEVADPQSAPPRLRPRSYRNSLKGARPCLREKNGHRGTSLSQETGPTHLSSSVSSRPTTADAEGETAASTYSMSWREEWTPGSKPVEKNLNVGFVIPATALGGRPPPLPPLPTKPPEQGSLSGNQASVSPSGNATGTYKVDDAALRRICQSKSVNAATPPPLDWRLGSESRTSETPNNDDGVASTIANAESILKESPCMEHEEEHVSGVEFSELACAFATLEVN